MRVLSSVVVMMMLLVVAFSGGVADADLSKPYFNLTLETAAWDTTKVGKAFSGYFHTPTKVSRVDSNDQNGPVGGLQSYIFEFFDANGASTETIRQESKSLANSLSSDYDNTLKTVKGQFGLVDSSIIVSSLYVILRTTTFELQFTEKSCTDVGSYSQVHEAMNKGLLAVFQKYHAPFTGNVETLMESSGTANSVRTNAFQFDGSNGPDNSQKLDSNFPLSSAVQGDWNTLFVNNGGLSLTGGAVIHPSTPYQPPVEDTGFGAWVSANPEIVVGIGAGLFIVIFAVVLFCVHRRAKRQEMLRETMEAMLGEEDQSTKERPRGNSAAGNGGPPTASSASPGKRPAGKGGNNYQQPSSATPKPRAAPAPTGGQPAAAPAPSGGQPTASAAPSPPPTPPQQQEEKEIPAEEVKASAADAGVNNEHNA